MKVLFADASSLCRYSTILVAKQCASDITVLEAEALYEVNLMLEADKIPTLFININTLEDQALGHIQNIRNLQQTGRIILVINSKAEYEANKYLAAHVDEILCLEDTLENSRAHIDRILNTTVQNDKQKPNRNLCNIPQILSYRYKADLIKSCTSLIQRYCIYVLPYHMAYADQI